MIELPKFILTLIKKYNRSSPTRKESERWFFDYRKRVTTRGMLTPTLLCSWGQRWWRHCRDPIWTSVMSWLRMGSRRHWWWSDGGYKWVQGSRDTSRPLIQSDQTQEGKCHYSRESDQVITKVRSVTSYFGFFKIIYSWFDRTFGVIVQVRRENKGKIFVSSERERGGCGVRVSPETVRWLLQVNVWFPRNQSNTSCEGPDPE